jgi:hypothetical protein
VRIFEKVALFTQTLCPWDKNFALINVLLGSNYEKHEKIINSSRKI